MPQELRDKINKYGGKIKPTWGVPVEEIQRGISHGVRKINVDTDYRLAITGAIRKVFAEDPPSSIRATTSKPGPRGDEKGRRPRMRDFGQAGHARDYEAKPLEDMRLLYA